MNPINEFLDRCQISSNETIACFEEIFQYLEKKETRTRARQFLKQLYDHQTEHLSSVDMLATYHFSLDKLVTDGEEQSSGTLLLLQFPSTFAPEDWSFTFFEGLLRAGAGEFSHRMVCELGCGNGWISLALLKRFHPSKILGLDINPRAILSANINKYLNCLGDQGDTLLSPEGTPYIDQIEFQQSDLLEYCRSQNITLDRVIGCIPQVLNPNPEMTAKLIANEQNDEHLYSLSNYTDKQGYVEDTFGLGLIARALEESIEQLRASGKIYMNLGGRPGSEILKKLFLRRGLSHKIVWQTNVQQARDTDISSLVAIEQNSSHRFEFTMGNHSEECISATMAQAYVQHGGTISHSLSVYEAQMNVPIHLKKIMSFIRKSNNLSLRNKLDFEFNDTLLAEEKLSFLDYLSDKLSANSNFPYEATTGEGSFRRRVASFFRSYYHLPVTAKNIVIYPNEHDVIRNALTLIYPKCTLIESKFYRHLDFDDIKKFSIFESPRTVDQLIDIIKRIKPNLVVTSLLPHEIKTKETWLKLIQTCEEQRCHLLLNLSEDIELTSRPASHGLLKWLTEHPLPGHVALFCGFVKNKVYQDLQISFILSENQSLLHAFVGAAELSFSRSSLIPQYYYDKLLFDLLNFQMNSNKRSQSTRTIESSTQEQGISLSSQALRAFEHPAVKDEPSSADVIRLDYGENELPSPPALKNLIFESFIRQNIQLHEYDPTPELKILLKNRFGLSNGYCGFSEGVAPLFAKLCRYLKAKDAVLYLPQGAYGHFKAVAQFYGVTLVDLHTHAQDSFKVTTSTLQKQLQKPGAVFLNAPITNPTGQCYGADEMTNLLNVIASHKSFVIWDTIFAGLEFQDVPYTSIGNYLSTLNIPYVLVGGISKEYAAGGLRLGYFNTNMPLLKAALKTTEPHSSILYATKHLWQKYLEQDTELMSHLFLQKQKLRENATKLSGKLQDIGFQVLEPQGGLFLIASAEPLYGRNYRGTMITEENIHHVLHYEYKVLGNSAVWTSLRHHLRFVFSTKIETLNQAVINLTQFQNSQDS